MRPDAKRLVASLVACLTASGCGRPAPAAPSVIGGTAGPPALISDAATPTTTWNCLTASQMGIFAAARACPTTARASALTVRAAVVPPGDVTSLTAMVNAATVTLSWVPPVSGDPVTSYVIEAVVT